jgi:hypothetical protein
MASLARWLVLGGSVVATSACGASTLDEGRDHPDKPSIAIDEDSGVGGATSGGAGTQSPAMGSASQPGTKPTSGGGMTIPSGTPTPTGGTGTTKPGTSTTDQPPVTTPPVMLPPIVKPPIALPPAGTSVTPPAQVDNCEPSTVHSDEKYCETIVSCDNATLYASCYDNGGGGWDCGCSNGYTSLSYRVAGADAGICDSSIVLCTPGQEPELSDVTCGSDYAYTSSNYCSSQRSCTRTAELEGGLQAQLQDYQQSSCQDLLDGSISCWCAASGTQRNYEFTGTELSDTCSASLDLCANSEAPTFPAEQTCEPQYRSDYGTSCEYSILCKSTVEVSPGVTAVAQESQYSNCYQQTTNGPWGCSCSSGQLGLNFEIANEVISSAELCPNALSVCEDFDPSALTGEVACKQNSQYAGTGYCSATAVCTQDGNVGGLDLSLKGSISTSCQVGEDGSWSCVCYGGVSQVALEVEAADEWDACGQAIAECPDLVPRSVGGGAVGIPTPGRPIPL